MLTVRRLLFHAWIYLAMAVVATGLSPALLMPRRFAVGVVKAWAHSVLFGMRWIMGVTLEYRGLEHRPKGGALVAPKHQSMLDIVAAAAILDDSCFVLKKELMYLPFIGWFAWKARMIPVDRSGHAKALKDMLRAAKRRLLEGSQVVIFPEGTRQAPGAPPDYKPGVAAIYRELEAPCWPCATNAGEHWPAKGMAYNPGVVVFEFLEPIPAGLKRAQFMSELETRIEAATARLAAASQARP